ncbi:hypothetical protein C8R42DRAFT_657988 [Lentinula raphanica]|nr:hypothetical protein C8R42DRAFT_657988 [Lentinula raphanica]
MPPNPQTVKHQITASAAASIVTVNASLICSSSGDTFPSTQSSGSHLTTGSVPLSIAKDAVNSTELSSARLDKCIDEVIPTDTVCQEASANIPGQNTVSSSSPDDPDDLESGFVFVSALTFVETQTPSRRRNSILQSLNFTSKIPRRLSLSLSPKSKSKYTARVVDTESPRLRMLRRCLNRQQHEGKTLFRSLLLLPNRRTLLLPNQSTRFQLHVAQTLKTLVQFLPRRLESKRPTQNRLLVFPRPRRSRY